MSQLTIKLPTTLHNRLTYLATHEGISLQNYILYALSHQAATAYVTTMVSEKEIAEQKAMASLFLQSVESATDEEVKAIFDEREIVEPEPELEEEVIHRLTARIAEREKGMTLQTSYS